jgi:catechol 2,3-dioxygenase-like lactoylglutathione lyase family enzyme
MSVVPIRRIFDIAKADEFYLGFLGFKVDWDHRFDDNAPLYRQALRGDLVLRLSEPHGDGSPGATARHDARGRRIPSRNQRQGLSVHALGSRTDAMGRALETGAIDPFGNLIRFAS